MKTNDPFAPNPLDAPTKLRADAELIPLLIGAVPAARLLGISRTTLDALTRKGEIPRVKLAGRVLYSRDVLQAIARGDIGGALGSGGA